MTEAPTRHLGDVASFIRGITFKPGDVVPIGSPGSVACMRTKNVQSELDLSDVWGIPESHVKRPEQYLANGDLLISSANSWDLVGKCCRVPQLQWPATFGGFISVLRGDPSQIGARYLYHWFSSPRIQATVRSFGRQTTNISNLNVDRCLSLRLSVPRLAEQERIAGILDAAEALRAKRREALGQLDTFLRSSFLDMFGDPVTNPMKWTTSTLGQVGEVVTGNTPSRSRPEYYGEDIEWIKSDNINDPSFVLTEAKERLSAAGKAVARTVPRGSILVTCIAGSPSCIGNAAVADREVAFNQQINAFVPGGCIALWFAFGVFWVGKRLVNSASTNSMKGMVSKSAFTAIPIPIPPMSLQRRFAAIVESVEHQKATQRAHLAELDTLFASLQSRAFRGDL